MLPVDEIGSGDVVDEAVSDFMRLRPRLFGIAYRMLGSRGEAEDVVQDVWLRWQGTDRGVIRNPAAFLVTITTRVAINLLESARFRRETYIGPWLPEPIDTASDPEVGAARSEALGFAMFLLLEKLTPTERAAYILRRAFDHPYDQIAEILGLKEANVRQLVSRARKQLEGGRRTRVSSMDQRSLLQAFLSAAQSGDLSALQGLFASDIVSYSDGGGLARAARVPIAGRQRVAQFIAAVASHFWLDTKLLWREMNGQASVIVWRDGAIIAIVTIDASLEGIDHIFWLMNPDKLRRVSSQTP